MSRSEFRYNKKRKHYAYLFKDVGTKRKCILITSKPIMIERKHKRNRIVKNVLLFHHPNISKAGNYFLIPRIYIDDILCFDVIIHNWNWNINDKRKVKRIKKNKNIQQNKNAGYDTTNSS